MGEKAKAEDAVEGAISKGQGLRIAANESQGFRREIDSLPRILYHLQRDVRMHYLIPALQQ
jgi:hypothetical protein